MGKTIDYEDLRFYGLFKTWFTTDHSYSNMLVAQIFAEFNIESGKKWTFTKSIIFDQLKNDPQETWLNPSYGA